MALRELTPLPQVRRPAQPAPDDARVVTEIYRPFFLAGIASVLTAGCLLGAIALLGIAIQGSYTASAWTPYVLAHANSQLYGWVGFFVIGFALQQHAPRQSRFPLFKRLAGLSLVFMAAGIALRFVAEPLVMVEPAPWLAVGVVSCILQAVAVGLFMATIALTRFKTGDSLTWQSTFVFTSLFWWMLVALAEPFFFAWSHGSQGQLFTAQWFSPYREAQFLGFVTMMIFGVALVKMSSCFGARPACETRGRAGFLLWNAGLLLRMAGWSVHFQSDLRNPFLWHLGGALLAAGAMLLVSSTRMFEPLASQIRSSKFIRAAFGWLLVAGLLVIAEPIHLYFSQMAFSHAYTGAIRHALTVGFISQMIVGVSLHVVAKMNDLDDSRLDPVWTTFWLLNIGNAARAVLEIATDYTGRAFLPMGATGFIELIALAFWAVNIVGSMVRRRKQGYAG